MFEKVSVAITEVLEDKKIIQSSTKEVCAYGISAKIKLSQLREK